MTATTVVGAFKSAENNGVRMQRFIFIQLLCHLTPGEEESVSSSEFFMFLPATPKKKPHLL